MWRELLIRGLPRAAIVIATSAAIGGTSSVARAHGSAPAAIDVLATDAARAPTVVALSSGLARRESSGAFSFVCPAAWGSEDAVLAARGDLVAAVAGGKLHVGGSGCSLAPREREETMVDVVGTDAGLLALGKTPTSTRVLALTATDTSVRAEASHSGPAACVLDAVNATSDGRLIGACAAPRPALFVPAEDESVRPFVLPFAVSRLVPRVVSGGTISLLAITSKGSFLVDLDEAEAQPAPRIAGPFAIVLGPVQVDDRRVAVIDGHLWTLHESGWTQGAAVPFTCLSQVGAEAFACSLGTTVRLVRKGDDIVAGEAVFSLAMVGEPTSACADATGDAAVCRGEWAHFGAEAGLLDTRPATSPEGVRLPNDRDAETAPLASAGAGEDGCAAVPRRRSATGWMTAIAAGAALLLGRRASRHRLARRARVA